MRWGSSAGAAIFAAFALGAGLASMPSEALAQEPYFLSIGGGVFDFGRTQVGEGRIELRFADSFLFLKPMLGLLVTSQGSIYGYGGLRLDLYLGSRFVVTPNAALGGYHRGGGLNLGATLEFKTGAEIAYRLDDHSRLGVAIDHISNAGITKQNPGSNSAVVYYSYPFGPMQ